MGKPVPRESRRAARQAKIRRRRIIVGAALLILLAVVSFVIYSAVSGAAGGEVITTASGLKYQDLKVGTGKQADPLDLITVHYTGLLADGTKFDSSLDRGKPFQLTLGTGMVIKGWDEGIVGMKEGGKRKLIIPPELAYGEKGYPPTIPPNSTLVFEVELLEVQ